MDSFGILCLTFTIARRKRITCFLGRQASFYYSSQIIKNYFYNFYQSAILRLRYTQNFLKQQSPNNTTLDWIGLASHNFSEAISMSIFLIYLENNNPVTTNMIKNTSYVSISNAISESGFCYYNFISIIW